MIKMNRKRVSLFLILFLSTGMLTGCWGKKELTDLAIISALGIDKTEEGRYVGTLQIINPGNVAGGLQGGGGGQGPPISVFTATGDNLVEMSRRVSSEVSRRIYYAHTNLLVIGEKLAREEGIATVFDAIERDPEFRATTTLVIAQNSSAANLLKMLTPIDKIPANKIIKTLKFTEAAWGEQMHINLQEAIKHLNSPGKEPVVTGFFIKGDVEKGKKAELKEIEPEAILVAGDLAMFKDGKLVNWIREEKAKGTVWLLNKLKKTAVTVDWKDKKEAISYELIRQKTKMSANVKKGKPKITVKLRAEGDIGEITVPENLTDPTILLDMEKAIEKEIKKEIEGTIRFAQENRTDIFGFGEVVYRSDPKAWKKLKQDWNELYFPELEVEVKVDAFIRRTGLRNQPYFSSQDK